MFNPSNCLLIYQWLGCVCSHEQWTSTFWSSMPTTAAAAAVRSVQRERPSMLHQMRRHPALIITTIRQSAICCLRVQRLQTTTTHQRHRRRTTATCRRWLYTSSPSERYLSSCLSWPSSTSTSTSSRSIVDVAFRRLRRPSSEHTLNGDDDLDVATRPCRLEETTVENSRTDELGWRCAWSQLGCSPDQCRTNGSWWRRRRWR